MTSSENPYQSPNAPADSLPAQRPAEWDRFSAVGWPVVYLLNIGLPLVWGWGLTSEAGRVGMYAAMAVVLFAGWWWLPRRPWLARREIAGAVVTALSQFFPVLHMLIGMASISLVQAVSNLLAGEPLDAGGGDPIGSEPAGFAVTMLVGGSLILCSLAVGLVLGLMLPRRWMSPREDWEAELIEGEKHEP